MAVYGSNYGQTRFEFDREQELEIYRVALAATPPCPRGTSPIGVWLVADNVLDMESTAEKLSLPECMGNENRIVNGYLYMLVVLRKPEEIPERQKEFREKIRPFIDDYDGEWKKAMAEWIPILDEFKERCHPERLKQLSNVDLWELFEDHMVRIHRKFWTIHFYFLLATYSLYNLFTDLCQELTGIDLEHPTFKKLLGGFDTATYQVNRELWQLGERAKELGLEPHFQATPDDEELLSQLEASDAGREWLAAYREFINARGWRISQSTFDLAYPTWIEKPSLALHGVRSALAQGGAFTPDAVRERLVKEREQAEKEVLAKVPAQQRDWFEKVMKVAEKASWWTEEHTEFLDFPAPAISAHIWREYGRRFSEAGVIEDPGDVIFLLPDDIRKAAMSMERNNLRRYVEKRREEWQKHLEWELEPVIGDFAAIPEVARKNPIIRIFIAPQKVRPELKADLYGGSSTPGVAEGSARVIMGVRDLNQVQPGEILVTPMTNALWTPIFSIIAAVVTDTGASLSHAAIVAREYGIPSVVGTLEATKKIKTGMRLRVDGDMSSVYILEK